MSASPRASLARAVARLEASEQLLLSLTRLEGLDVSQVAAALDLPPSRVAADLDRTERKLHRLASKVAIPRRRRA